MQFLSRQVEEGTIDETEYMKFGNKISMNMSNGILYLLLKGSMILNMPLKII